MPTLLPCLRKLRHVHLPTAPLLVGLATSSRASVTMRRALTAANSPLVACATSDEATYVSARSDLKTVLITGGAAS